LNTKDMLVDAKMEETPKPEVMDAWNALIEKAFTANNELQFAMKSAGINRAERRRMMKFVTSGSSIINKIAGEVTNA